MQEVIYEAFGPNGVGIIIEAATDNKQRTVVELKNILERNGGVLAATGAVSHLFKYAGLINSGKNLSADQTLAAAINSGATDMEESEDSYDIYTEPKDLHRVKEMLIKEGITVTLSELCYRPVITVGVDDEAKVKQLLKLLSSIEEMDDVQKVFANFDIPDKILLEK